MFIFNDVLLLQLLIMLTLVSVLWSSELLFTGLNSVLFLLLVSLYLYALNLDVLVNFLIVIDLGLFFSLIALVLNFSTLYSSSLNPLFSSSRTFYKVSALIVLSAFVKLLFGMGGVLPYLETNVVSYLLQENFYFNWLNVLHLPFPNDLSLLNDVYFNFNLGEFVILNFLLYLAILTSYLLTILLKSTGILTLSTAPYSSKVPTFHFFKTQGFQKQIMQSASVRVWSKTKVRKLGSTENLD